MPLGGLDERLTAIDQRLALAAARPDPTAGCLRSVTRSHAFPPHD